jgi:hypothetical protein
LVAVDPISLAMVHCAKTGDRSAAAWQQALTPFTAVELIVSDAAMGIAKGVRAVSTLRQAENPAATPITHGLDVFHTSMEAQRVLRQHWRRAETVWEQAEQADVAVTEAKRRGQSAQKQASTAYQAWRQAEQKLTQVEKLEAAWQRAHSALNIFRTDGTLNDRVSAEAEIASAVADLSGPEWRKTRNFLADKRTLAFLDRLHGRLAQAVPQDALRRACLRRWWLKQKQRRSVAPATTAQEQVLQLLDAVVRDSELQADEQQAYERVAAILDTTVRASSAVEGINSVLRMQQCRHRRVTQGLLDLKRLYWNCRKLPTGRRRGRSPYEMLGVTTPNTDFWELLQAPQKPTQAVSTSGLTG